MMKSWRELFIIFDLFLYDPRSMKVYNMNNMVRLFSADYKIKWIGL